MTGGEARGWVDPTWESFISLRRQRLSKPRRSRLALLLPFVVYAVGLHFLGLVAAVEYGGWLFPKPPPGKPVQLVTLLPPEPEKLPEPEPEEPDWDGQIVETPDPEQEIDPPEDAEYLAEHNERVEEETRSRDTRINPEVLTKDFHLEDKVEKQDLVDVDVTKPSTGAQVGNDRFDPAKDGSLAALPSKWRFTNRDGYEAPVPAASTQSVIAGAPQADLLDEKPDTETNLNTKEFLYAAYLLQIRRLVAFYWEQNLDNLSGSVRLVKPKYNTDVEIVLDANGALIATTITEESGSEALDDAVVRAYKIAGPFPPPPEGLVSPDGRAYLPPMGWTVTVGQAQNRYQGVDPRAGVRFPGLLKSPR
ncbi:MAG: energy transducer TonB [Deltaproteobacteria bacterium]|nr:MAG: energy transducer TonB [Deltaproteobacteria bacterium]